MPSSMRSSRPTCRIPRSASRCGSTAYGNPIYDVYIRKVVKRPDGKYWNVPIETYPNVSQFWKYDPETYLKQPAYSRSFQGIKKT